MLWCDQTSTLTVHLWEGNTDSAGISMGQREERRAGNVEWRTSSFHFQVEICFQKYGSWKGTSKAHPTHEEVAGNRGLGTHWNGSTKLGINICPGNWIHAGKACRVSKWKWCVTCTCEKHSSVPLSRKEIPIQNSALVNHTNCLLYKLSVLTETGTLLMDPWDQRRTLQSWSRCDSIQGDKAERSGWQIPWNETLQQQLASTGLLKPPTDGVFCRKKLILQKQVRERHKHVCKLISCRLNIWNTLWKKLLFFINSFFVISTLHLPPSVPATSFQKWWKLKLVQTWGKIFRGLQLTVLPLVIPRPPSSSMSPNISSLSLTIAVFFSLLLPPSQPWVLIMVNYLNKPLPPFPRQPPPCSVPGTDG